MRPPQDSSLSLSLSLWQITQRLIETETSASTYRHETPFVMTTSILQGRRRILQYPSRAHETGHKIYILRCTAGIRSREFPSKHTRNLTPPPLLPTSGCTSSRGAQVSQGGKTRTNRITRDREENHSLDLDLDLDLDARRENRHRSREGGHRKKRLAETTENPSSASAQRLAPDTSTLPTTPQPPSHAG